ncbi:glycoside hydrolase family 88 protein [Niabella terrae]
MFVKWWPLAWLLFWSCGAAKPAVTPPAAGEVLALIHKVNKYWQQTHPEPGNAFWDEAAYQTANIAAFRVTGDTAYRNYALRWAEHNQWRGAGSDDKKRWMYHYGETPEHVLFGDWQVCFQTYLDLYMMDSVKQPYKIARAREVMEYEMATPRSDYWWWADGLYMVMPVMTRLYHATGNQQYLDKLYEYFAYATQLMYDSTEALYYRDAKYIYPQHQTERGRKDFWSRGNGWALAALASTLNGLPDNDVHRPDYLRIFQKMAASIRKLQEAEGYWTRSMMDAAQAPGFETSGTAFFTYGLIWGIRHGYLDSLAYGPVVMKAWNYLTTTAVQKNGVIGYVQPIGERAIPGQVVDRNSTANFGVGAFLLAATEMYTWSMETSRN